jgi:hypothetical protein
MEHMTGGQRREPPDDWEADFFRRGCSFLSRRMAPGAASSWRSLNLPPDRRAEVYFGPLAARPLTVEETERFRGMLERIERGE